MRATGTAFAHFRVCRLSWCHRLFSDGFTQGSGSIPQANEESISLVTCGVLVRVSNVKVAGLGTGIHSRTRENLWAARTHSNSPITRMNRVVPPIVFVTLVAVVGSPTSCHGWSTAEVC